jgi:hypothetical protein
MIVKNEVKKIIFQKTSDVDNDEYIVEALDEDGNILFLVVGDENSKKVTFEFDTILSKLKIEYTLFLRKVEEAKSIVQTYLDSL